MPNPPEHTKFKPGQSGNPKGNALDRHSTKSISSWINEMLNDDSFTAMIMEGYELKEFKGAPMRAIIGTQIKLAMGSKDESVRIKAADLLMKHGSTQKLLLGNDPDNPLTNTHQLTDDELNDRLREIVASTKGGSKPDTARAGQTQSKD